MGTSNRLILPLLVGLVVVACRDPKPYHGVLSPTLIEVTGYRGLTKHFNVEFQFDGQPLSAAAFRFELIASDSPAIQFEQSPLGEQLTLSYSPTDLMGETSRFSLTYRKQVYEITVRGEMQPLPECVEHPPICHSSAFDVEQDACELTPLEEGTHCGPLNCASQAICQDGACVTQELPHEAPSCPDDVPATLIKPIWTYEAVHLRITQPVMDDEGNSYFFDCPDCELVSLNPAGQERWRMPLLGDRAAEPPGVQLQVFDGRVVVLEQGEVMLRAFRATDGKPEWNAKQIEKARILITFDMVWLLLDPTPTRGPALSLISAANGQMLNDGPRMPGGPNGEVLNGTQLVQDANGRVFVIGTEWSTPPRQMTVAAFSGDTGSWLWAQFVSLGAGTGSSLVAVAGNTLVLGNGVAIDADVQTVLENEGLQRALAGLSPVAFALQPDASGYLLANSGQSSCPLSTLSHLQAREGLLDWTCFLGSAAMNAGKVENTPLGSAVLLTGEYLNDSPEARLVPVVRVFNARGQAAFKGRLDSGDRVARWSDGQVVHGERVLSVYLRKSDSDSDRLVAYDIPELLTK